MHSKIFDFWDVINILQIYTFVLIWINSRKRSK
jgi:hypothetical protein